MRAQVNYLYFGAYLAILLLFYMSNIFTKELFGSSPIFFSLYAFGQILVEIALWIALAWLFQKLFGRVGFFFLIGASFFALCLHFFDYLMDRILDLSVWEALNVFVLQENWENFSRLLDASGISLLSWAIFFIVVATLPLLGNAIYFFTDKIAQKRPLIVKSEHFFQLFLSVPLALFLWEAFCSKTIHPDGYTAFRKSLPWKSTFLQPEKTLFALKSPPQPILESQAKEEIGQDVTVLAKRPNIFLFIVESLREDVICPEIAPYLSAFKKTALHFKEARSGGNATHPSWFSIFHAQMAYHWQRVAKTWKMGSPPLTLLKKWGYKIHLYSSADLSYYGMDQVLFGSEHQLLDTEQIFHFSPPLSAADGDWEMIHQLQRDLAEKPDQNEGQLFIVFLDSTHFPYYWPSRWTPKWTPFAKEFDFLKTIQSKKQILSIKNRYYNAVHYIDHLLGGLIPKCGEEAIIVFTGDHGEEFFEHGHLFHNSHLTKEQIHVPLYLKLGKEAPQEKIDGIISHIDIFPLISDYLRSRPILLKREQAVTARFNAGLAPYEFCIDDGKHKCIAQFSNRSDIYQSKELKIISFRTSDDKLALSEDFHSLFSE